MKEIINKTKRQHPEWKKKFANNISNKGLIPQIYKTHITQYQKNNNPIKKWTEDLNRHFFKEDIKMDNTHKKSCPTSLSIREVHIKTTMRNYLTSVRMAIIKKTTNNKHW